jgi:hypothetical protein
MTQGVVDGYEFVQIEIQQSKNAFSRLTQTNARSS